MLLLLLLWWWWWLSCFLRGVFSLLLSMFTSREYFYMPTVHQALRFCCLSGCLDYLTFVKSEFEYVVSNLKILTPAFSAISATNN